jgi:hypothetical protein
MTGVSFFIFVLRSHTNSIAVPTRDVKKRETCSLNSPFRAPEISLVSFRAPKFPLLCHIHSSLFFAAASNVSHSLLSSLHLATTRHPTQPMPPASRSAATSSARPPPRPPRRRQLKASQSTTSAAPSGGGPRGGPVTPHMRWIVRAGEANAGAEKPRGDPASSSVRRLAAAVWRLRPSEEVLPAGEGSAAARVGLEVGSPLRHQQKKGSKF